MSAPLGRVLTFSLADDLIYPARTIAASLDGGAISVVYGKRLFSRVAIRGVREYPFDGKYPQPEFLASSIALAVNALGARKAPVTLSIPKAWTVITTAEFPLTVKENLSDVISYELDRITPLTSANAFFDFRVLEEKEGKLSVLVVAVRADLVEPYIDALREKGISVSRLTTNLSGFEVLSRFIGSTRATIFLDVSANGYEGALFDGTAITNIVAGSFPATDERLCAERLRQEIAPLIDEVKKSGRDPRFMIRLRQTSPGLKESLKAQVPHPIMFLGETDIKVKYPPLERTPPYAAIGAVLESLWPRAHGVNLLSKGLREESSPPKFFTVILLLCILGLWIVYLFAPLKTEEKRLAEIDRQIAARKEDVKKVEALKKEIEAVENEVGLINTFKVNRRMTLDILKELTAILPKSAWLSRVRVSETAVELEGYASAATGLLSKLEASPFFRKVEFSSPTFRDTRMNADRFNIKMEIEGVNVEIFKAKEEGEEFDEAAEEE